MKICKDCRSCLKGKLTDWPMCERTKSVNPVTGEAKYLSCDTERSIDPLTAFLLGDCGKSGRYFEGKE